MPVEDDDGWGGGDVSVGWGGNDAEWAVSARRPQCDGVRCNDGWGCIYCEEIIHTSEEIIRDVVRTMVSQVCADSRVEARSVTAEMLRCAMRAHWSPLHRVVSGCRLIDDLRSGRVTPLVLPGRFEFLEDVVLDLEHEVRLYAECHVNFDPSGGDLPTGWLYYGYYYGYDEAFYEGKNLRGAAGRCGLIDH